MKKIRIVIIFAFIIGAANSQNNSENFRQRILDRVGQITAVDTTYAHDPVIIKENDKYYIFSTGWGINVYSSDNLDEWKFEKPIFMNPPQWAMDSVPGYHGHTWAPDIAYHNGRYLVYYSVSTFGKNRSAIGVASNKTLDSNSSDFKWVDHGPVILSTPKKTNWNAIDANFILDKNGNPYLSFGSFWGGIMLAKLSDDGLSVAQSYDDFINISTRKLENNAVEAPFIFKKDGWYYLFVSYDFCCRGAESTYKVVVGRSKSLKGEYFDKDGVSLLDGGGTLVVEGNEKYAGVGHNAVATLDGVDYLLFHAYDMSRKGASYLRILPITWQDEWPTVTDDF